MQIFVSCTSTLSHSARMCSQRKKLCQQFTARDKTEKGTQLFPLVWITLIKCLLKHYNTSVCLKVTIEERFTVKCHIAEFIKKVNKRNKLSGIAEIHKQIFHSLNKQRNKISKCVFYFQKNYLWRRKS